MSIWDYKNIHMVGVKGVGMTALAEILKKNGFALSGSDTREEFMTDDVLARLGIDVLDFHENNVQEKDAVIHSNAYTPEHPEMKAAKDAGIPIFSYPQVVAELFNAHRGVAVAGSHGKTTTTAMLAHIFRFAGKNAVAIVGSKALNWQSGAIAGVFGEADTPFVLEADEYKEAFLHYRPKSAVVTNIDWDHPDYFKTPEVYMAAFEKFVSGISQEGFLIFNDNDALVSKIAKSAICTTIPSTEGSPTSFSLKVGGAHNQSNARLAYQAAVMLGVTPEVTREALADFEGTARRLELVGESGSALVYDDYAHHPTEIRATLRALKEKYPSKKIIAVFQPHTFSRTKALFDGFVCAFSDADMAVLADVYPSAREKKKLSGGVNMEEMAERIRKEGTDVIFVKKIADIPHVIEKIVGSIPSVVITLGAGDIWQIAKQLTESNS